jgi:hypothetical protein
MTFSLVRCAADGVQVAPIEDIHDAITATYAVNADLYAHVGFIEPWVSPHFCFQK